MLRNWEWPEVSVPGADQKYRGFLGREWAWFSLYFGFLGMRGVATTRENRKANVLAKKAGTFLLKDVRAKIFPRSDF